MSSALFKRDELARNQTAIERFIAGMLLLVSLAGSVLFGGGGFEAWRHLAPNWLGAAAALAVQILCTWAQWTYAEQRWGSYWWLAAFGVSLALTAAGFWPLAHPQFVAGLIWCQVPATTAPYIAGGLIVVLAGVLDYMPEQILTE